MPPDVNALIETWRATHKDYEHLLFNDATADKFIAEHYNQDIRLAFRRAQEPAQRADIFRLAYLSIEGGYYIDVDDRCSTRLDAFVPGHAEFVGYQENLCDDRQ